MRICVYGAASDEIDKSYITEGEKLGEQLAVRGHSLVFGGGASGMMGAVARGVYKHKGYIKGVAPSFFNVDGRLFAQSNEMIMTDTMRQRKQIMEDSSDAFIVSPGGIGTFEEFFEMLTLKSLDRHTKPIAILNTNGYYDDLLSFLQNGVKENFLRPSNLKLYFVSESVNDVLSYIENYTPEDVDITTQRFV